jgi:cytoskeletal protein RodZ
MVSYTLLVCVSMMLASYAPPYSPGVQAFLFLFIVPGAVGMLALVAYQQWKLVQAKLRARNESQAMAAKKQVDVEMLVVQHDHSSSSPSFSSAPSPVTSADSASTTSRTSTKPDEASHKTAEVEDVVVLTRARESMVESVAEADAILSSDQARSDRAQL